MEATNGKLRAYTIVVVTDIAIITKAGPGRLMSFVVDRRSGDPDCRDPVRVWIDQKEVAAKATDQQGLVDTSRSPGQAGKRRGAGNQRGRVRHQYARRMEPGRRSRSQFDRLHLYRSPGVSAGRHGALQTIVRAQTMSGYMIPQSRDLRLEMRDPRTTPRFGSRP